MIPLADPEMLNIARPRERAVAIHSHALVETHRIGPGTRISPFVHVAAGAAMGRDCVIDRHATIDDRVRLGDRVTVGSCVHLRPGTVVEDDVQIGANVSLATEPGPKNKRFAARFEGVTLRRGCMIGAGAILYPGVEIAAGAVVPPGAVVRESRE